MSNFSRDEKWLEAKNVVGGSNWIEVIHYYRSIKGANVLVYTVRDGEKKLIVDLIDDDNILLLNKDGSTSTDTYPNVFNSKKVFKYTEDQSLIEAIREASNQLNKNKSELEWT